MMQLAPAPLLIVVRHSEFPRSLRLTFKFLNLLLISYYGAFHVFCSTNAGLAMEWLGNMYTVALLTDDFGTFQKIIDHIEDVDIQDHERMTLLHHVARSTRYMIQSYNNDFRSKFNLKEKRYINGF